MNALPRFSFSIYSISKQYSTFYFSFLTSSQFLKPTAVLLQSYHCTEISCLKIKKPVMDRINGVFSSTSYLTPLRHLEIMIAISLKFSSLCSILWLLLKHQCWLSLLRGLLKCVSMGLVYCLLLILNTPIGFTVFPPLFMEIQLLLIHWLMKFLIIHVYHEVALLHTNWWPCGTLLNFYKPQF